MNKQEAIEMIESSSFDIDDTDLVVGLSYTKNIINQIDEPQKPVVPKFVAEWLEQCKRCNLDLQTTLSRLDDDEKVGDWAYDENDDLISEKVDMIARAWLDGYTVEKEKLYTVEIGGVSSGKLFKNIRTNKYLFHSGKGLKGYTDRLTEAEIKQKDERLWQFAKPVEELK